MKRYVAILIFLTTFISQISGNTDRIYPGFFPSSANIERLSIDVHNAFIKFSDIRKILTPTMLTMPKFGTPHRIVKTTLLKIKKMMNDKKFIQVHKLLFDIEPEFKTLDFMTNRNNRIKNTSMADSDFLDSISKKIAHINSLKPVNFTELINNKRKIMALKEKLDSRKLEDAEFQKMLNLMETYLVRYKYYCEFSEAKKILVESRKLQNKLNSIWNLCRSIRRNPNLNNLVDQCSNWILDGENLFRKSQFTKCIRKMTVTVRSQTIAIKKITEVANAWKLEKKEKIAEKKEQKHKENNKKYLTQRKEKIR